MMRTAITALFLTACLAAFAPTSSAGHTFCHSEPQDINLDVVGVDGPLLDADGIQVCVLNNTFTVESTLLLGHDGTPPPGTGVYVRSCHALGTTADECSTAGGNEVILGWTGASVGCAPPPAFSVCIYVDGVPL